MLHVLLNKVTCVNIAMSGAHLDSMDMFHENAMYMSASDQPIWLDRLPQQEYVTHFDNCDSSFTMHELES